MTDAASGEAIPLHAHGGESIHCAVFSYGKTMKRVSKSFSKRFGKRVNYDPESFPGLVDKATDEMQFHLDWGLVTTVCDKAAHTTDKEELRLGVRAARKRIQNEQHKVVMFGLQVIDALVKNNSTNFYFLQFMSEQKMMNSLVRLVDRGIDKGGRDNLEAMEKVLDMIQAWGEGYHTHQDKGVRLFVETYHKLRQRNVKFPRPLANQSVGIFTPKSSASDANNYPIPPQSNLAYPPAPTLQMPPTQRNANGMTDLEMAIHLSQQDVGQNAPATDSRALPQQSVPQTTVPLTQWLETVANMIALLEQSLSAAETKEEVQSSEIIKDLIQHLDASQKELMTRLENNVSEDDMHKLLHMNDSIHHVTELHAIVLAEGPRSKKVEKSVEEEQSEFPLVDLMDLAAMTQNAPSSPSASKENLKKSALEQTELKKQSTQDELLDLFAGTHENTTGTSSNDLMIKMDTSVLEAEPSMENAMGKDSTPVMNSSQDHVMMSNNAHTNPITNAMGFMPSPSKQMTRQQQIHMQNRGYNNTNGAMMAGFGRGQNYLAPTQGIASSQNMNSHSSSSNIGQLQHVHQEKQRANSNPFEAMSFAAPQAATIPKTKTENPFAQMMEPNTVANTEAMTNMKSNGADNFMYFNNGRRVSTSSHSSTANKQETASSNRDSNKTSPFGALGLKQPKSGKRRARGNSGSGKNQSSANDIFADLNDLALNPED